MGDEQAGRPTYQDALRVIGRYLDLEPAYALQILQNDNGFTVRTYRSAIEKDGVTVEFSWDRLKDLVVYHAAGRGCLRRRHRHQGFWADFRNGHEDFFRALGHNLDVANAHGLSVAELPDGIRVEYEAPREGAPDQFDRVEQMMHASEVEAIIREAQNRRRSSAPTGS